MEFKASYHQERLWFIDQFEAGNIYEFSPVYHNIPLILRVQTAVDIERLKKSIKAVLRRHKALRTRIVTKDSRPVQVIDEEVEFKLEYLDLTDNGSENVEKYAADLAIDFAKQPFKLENGPLTRAKLMKISRDLFMLVLVIHHIISDRGSLKIIAKEIFLHYNALLKGEPPDLPSSSAHYPDFSQWQYGFSRDVLEAPLYYWKRKLKGKVQPLELPTDRPRAAIHVFHDGRWQFEITNPLFAKIQTFCRQNQINKSLVLLATFKILLYRYSNQEEIVVGISDENRNQPGLEHIVGPIANLLVLRSFLDEKSNFLKVLEALNETVTDAKKYKYIPFEILDQELKPAKDMSRTVFFDVLFQYEENHSETIFPGNPGIKILETNMGYGKYDLNLLLQEEMESIRGFLIYNKDYYNESTITRFVNHYIILLENILEAPRREISTVSMMGPGEKKKLLVDFNDTDAEYPKDKTINRLFREQLERTPDNIAAAGPTETKNRTYISYRELNQRADRLAGLLVKKGVRPDTIVGIMLDRSLEMVTSMLGILKAGGAYLPIDPDYPGERIQYILKDSNAKVLVVDDTSSASRLSFAPKALLNLSEGHHLNFPASQLPSFPASLPSSLAYIIYTSGTTGKPKGVLVEHRNVVRLMFNDAFQFDFHHTDTWTLFHSCCFDFSVWEMYGALLYGGKLVVIPKMTARDTPLFLRRLLEEGVTVLNQTPSAFYRLIDEELKQDRPLLHLKYVIFGGEALNPGKLKKWEARYPTTRLINMFGITETTVHVTYKEITHREIDLAVSNIGSPIPTLKVYILDKKTNLASIGVAGELCVGGDGVARGYLNRPALTAEKFDRDLQYPPGKNKNNEKFLQGGAGGAVFSKSAPPGRRRQKIYKSGDMARLLESGEMIYLGRIDTQVKIRGHRIELGEIENQLVRHEAVKEVVVIDRQDKDGDKYLCAYVVLSSPTSPGSSHPSGSTPQVELRNYLSGRLPDYMVPSYFVVLEKIPLTANGKVDRNQLPAPEIDVGEEYVAPGNELEKGIVYILSEIMGIDAAKIGVRANFFDLGVNSITLLKIAHRVSEEFNIRLPLSTLFINPTVEGVVEYMRKEHPPSKTKRLVLLNRGEASKNLFLITGDGAVYGMKELARLLESRFNVYAFQARGIMDSGKLPATTDEIVEEYYNEIKIVQPEGPYLLAGHCWGAFVAYQLAREMEDRENRLEKVIFFNEAAFMTEKALDYFRLSPFKKKLLRLYLRLIQFFIKKPAKEEKVEEAENKQEISQTYSDALPEDLEARRIEVQENFRLLYSNLFSYFKRVINTPMLDFKAADQSIGTEKLDMEKWEPRVLAKMTTKTMEIIETPGDHFSMFDLPHVSELARLMLEKI